LSISSQKFSFGRFFRKYQRRVLLFSSLILIYILLVRFAGSLNNYESGHWQSEIYSDKSGYYIYLPATFIYGFHQDTYPDSIDFKLGNGFGFVNGKMVNKYTCGVAIVTSPFFLATHLYQRASGGIADGFSPAYFNFTYTASVFYFLAGLISLWFFIRKRYGSATSALTLLFISAATNLFYYTFREPLLSHVYSFALFSFLLTLTDKLWQKPERKFLILTAVVAALIILIRPSNIIFLPVILFLDLTSISQLKQRLQFLFKPINLLIIISVTLIVILPQLVYWHFLWGQFIHYSYANEGFSNWNNPQILKVLFSPENGLIPYTPAVLVIFAGIIFMLLKRHQNRWLVSGIILIHLYLTASWHLPSFGCGFGHRTFVEYYALMAIPLAAVLEFIISNRKKLLIFLFVPLFLYLIYYNVRFSIAYDKCYLNANSWETYHHYAVKQKLIPFRQSRFDWQTGYEQNDKFLKPGKLILKSELANTGIFVNKLSPETEFSDAFHVDLIQIIDGEIYSAQVNINTLISEAEGNSLLVCAIIENGKTIYYSSIALELSGNFSPGNWTTIKHEFELPFIPVQGEMKIFIWNKAHKEILLDEFHVRLKGFKGIGIW